MPGRHQQRPPVRAGLRWLAGALSVGVAGVAGAAILSVAGPAGAAPTPNPSYHPGLETATFAVTGVLDSNCLVSTGGTEVWIKPGDKINFNSSLVGVNLSLVNGLIPGLLGKVAGLNVDATIDAGTSRAQAFSVAGGKTTPVPKAGQPVLSRGDHRLTWTARSIALAPGLLGARAPLPLSSSALKSGATLSWRGVIHVTNDTAKCKISVGTPRVDISVGPIKVTVPPINVGVPVPNLPKLPGLPGGGNPSTPGGTHPTTPGGNIHYTPPPLTVPEQAMGGIGGGGGFEGVLPNGAGSTQLGTNLPDPSATDPANPNAANGPGSKVKTVTKRIDLASNKAPAAQLPVLLAIVAIIALSLVTATYARLYLLRRNI